MKNYSHPSPVCFHQTCSLCGESTKTPAHQRESVYRPHRGKGILPLGFFRKTFRLTLQSYQIQMTGPTPPPLPPPSPKPPRAIVFASKMLIQDKWMHSLKRDIPLREVMGVGMVGIGPTSTALARRVVVVVFHSRCPSSILLTYQSNP